MKFQSYIEKNMDALIADLQGCIQIPSVYTEDASGYPYGKPVQDCLEYVLSCAEKLGFATVNMGKHTHYNFFHISSIPFFNII